MSAMVPVKQVNDELQRASDMGARSRASTTNANYAGAWRAFVAWAEPRKLSGLPVPPVVVVTYLSGLQERGLSVSSIRLAKAAIFAAHREANLAEPAIFGRVLESLNGVIREARLTHKVKQAHAVTEDEVGAMCAHTQNLRDRAIICLGFVAALRRSEIGALDICDLEFRGGDCTVTIQRSKKSQKPETIRFNLGVASEVLKRWIGERGCEPGPLFPSRKKGGHLSGSRVAKILKECADAAGIGGVRGHSLRVGYITATLKAGATVPSIMGVTRHKDPAQIALYARSLALGPVPKLEKL